MNDIRNDMRIHIESIKDQKNTGVTILEQERDNLMNTKYWKFELHERLMSFKSIYPQCYKEDYRMNTITDDLHEKFAHLYGEGITRPVAKIFICDVCSSMFDAASRAAYDIVYYDDDD